MLARVITFNATPDSGYVVDRWYVDGQDVGGVTPSILIQNVQADRTVLVTFKLQPQPDSETVTLTASEDTYVAESNPTLNFGNSTSLRVQTDVIDYYGLVKFNLNDIPGGSVVHDVELKLYCSYDAGSQIYIAESDSYWSESSVTWDTKPAQGYEYSFFYDVSGIGYQQIKHSVLTDLVGDWVKGIESNFGIYLYGGNVGDNFTFRSSEDPSSSYRPNLIVTYTPPPPPDLIITNLYPDPSPVNDTFYVGQSVNWYVTVKNNGGGQDDSSNVGYYLGTSSTDFSNPINSDSTDALNSGESDTDNDAYLFVASDVGQRYLICKADYQDDVEESSEDNNTRVYGPFNVAENVVPELSVTPDSQTVNYSARATTFAVDNTGTGTMLWTASVTSGGDWLSITSGSSGTNSGTITAAFSANTSGSTRTGTISVTASGAGGVSQDNGFASGWRHTRADLSGSCYYPYPSVEPTGNVLQKKFTAEAAYGSVLTGDVTGNGHLELIYVSRDQLKIYDSTGKLLHTVTLGSSSCSVSMLEDINGDGALDIGIGTGGTSDLKTYFYDGEGNLLKTFSKNAGSDCSMRPAGLLGNGDFIVSLNAGYRHSDMYRGFAVYDKETGSEKWSYKVGPAFGITSIADFDGDGMLDFANEAYTVHNGCNADGYNNNGTMTTDGDIWLIVVDKQGNEKFSRKYSSPSDGSSRHHFVDLNHDGVMEIVGFEGHDPNYYHGTSEIHLFDQNGEITHTFAGSENAGWSFTITDIDGDGKDEVIASNYPGGQTLYVLDHNLAMQNSAEIAGRVQLSCDLNGDGDIEVVLLDDDGNLKVVNKNLQVLNTINVGSHGTVIAGDLDQNGIVELICMTRDHGIHVFNNTKQVGQTKGDINADGSVDIADAILALKVSVGISGGDVYPDKDVNGDGKIGLEEVIYIGSKEHDCRTLAKISDSCTKYGFKMRRIFAFS